MTIEYDQRPTTASTRKWCVADFERLQTLLTHPGTSLPPELLALAQQHGGPTALAWPNWLIVGISLKFLLRELEAQLAPVVAEEPASERQAGLHTELEKVEFELKIAKGPRKKELMKRRAEIIEQLKEWSK